MVMTNRKYPIKYLILLAFLVVSFVSCFSCTKPEVHMPVKKSPAYFIEIIYPNKPGQVMVKQGDSFSVTVTVSSLLDVPINIRPVVVDAGGQPPQYLTYEPQKDYTTLAPRDSFSDNFTIKVAENAPVGTFSVGFHGDLQEPVPDRAGVTFSFLLTIISR
jgi:hypothetical protein